MKLVACVALSIAAVTAAFAQDSGKASVLADKLGDAFQKSDLQGINDVVAKNAAVYWISQKYFGQVAFDKYLRGQFDSDDHRTLSFNPDGGVEDETISTSWGTFGFTTSNSNNPISSQLIGRYTAIATEVDGKWRIISIHLSVSNPPDGPTIIN